MKATHYRVEPENNVKITGSRNGIYQVEISDDLIDRAIDKNERLDNFFAPLNLDYQAHEKEAFQIDFPFLHGTIIPSARATDIMGFSPFILGMPFIVSQKILKVFKDLEVDESEFRAETLS